MRTIRYRDIADDLRRRLDEGEFAAGRLLPSESELSAGYEVSRVTIRKALELLRAEERVDSRQGLGWFVATPTFRQPLARLQTLESQLEVSGQRSERRILTFAFTAAPPRVKAVLGVASVLKVRRLNLADGHPFALVTVWCPEQLGAHLSRAQVEKSSFYDLLGIELGGAVQTIGAAAADAGDAELLAIPVSSPVLVCQRITSDAGGAHVLMSEYVFPAHRTEFIVDLPHVESSIAPSGLRLVD